MEVVVQLLLEKVADEGAHGFPLGSHVGAAQLGLGLTLEDRLLHPNTDRSLDSGADVGGVPLLFVELAQGLDERFAEGRQMGAALGGVLPVDEGIILLAAAHGVGEDHIDVIAFQHDGFIERLLVDFFAEKVEEAMLRLILFAVVNEGQPRVLKMNSSGTCAPRTGRAT